jgi:hypothetical protein
MSFGKNLFDSNRQRNGIDYSDYSIDTVNSKLAEVNAIKEINHTVRLEMEKREARLQELTIRKEQKKLTEEDLAEVRIIRTDLEALQNVSLQQDSRLEKLQQWVNGYKSISTSSSGLKARKAKKIQAPCFGSALLILFLSKRERENLLGDLQEDFPKWVKKYGHWQARLMYYRDVISAIRPDAGKSLTWIAKKVRMLLSLAGAGEILRRIYHMIKIKIGMG